MARKTKGGGTLIPLKGGKGKKGSPTLDMEPQQDLLLPEKLLSARVTTKALTNGTYQKKLLALFAPVLIPELLNGLRRNMRLGEHGAQKLVADIFGMTPKASGTNVFVNQTNQQANASSGGGGSVTGMRSFADIVRIAQEERSKRALLPAAAVPVFEATPEE